MSIRHWLYAIAFWGCLSFGALSGAYADHHPNARAAKEQQAAAQEAQSQAPLTEHPHVKINTPSINQKECEEAEQNNEILDSCQQWRMANAADQTVDWARRQFWVTCGEIVALILTIAVSGCAAIAASRAATSANEAVDVASDTAKKQLRAYVSLAPAGFIYDKYTQKPKIRVEQSNTGQTPARNVRAWGMVDELDYPLPADFVFPEPDFGEAINTVHPGHKFYIPYEYNTSVPADHIKQMNIIAYNREVSKRFYFIGVIEYDDIYGRCRRKTRACWSIKIDDADLIESRRSTVIEVPFDYTGDHNDAD